MSEMLTNQAAGRLCREVQGACLTAARTQDPADVQRLRQLVSNTIAVRDIWDDVDVEAYQALGPVEHYVSLDLFAASAVRAGDVARLFEAACKTRSS